MPPSNSPSDTPTRRETFNRLGHLEDIVSRGLDLASTLAVQMADQANDDNVNFLRNTHLRRDDNDREREMPAARERRRMDQIIQEQRSMRLQQLAEVESANRRRRRALRNLESSSLLGRQGDHSNMDILQETTPSDEDLQDALALAGREGLQAYQGWAPGTEDDDSEEPHMTIEEMRVQFQELEARNNERLAFARRRRDLARPEPEVATRRHLREQELGIARLRHTRRAAQGNREMDLQTSRFLERGAEGADPTTTESSLRTDALIDSVRRQARFEPRSPWNGSGGERANERINQQLEERRLERERSTTTRLHRVSGPQRRDLGDDLRRAAPLDLHRVRARDEHGVTSSRWLEEAIKYLERLRFCDSESERLSFAEAGGFVDGESFKPNSDQDFILDTSSILPPHKSSWLRPGAVFTGSQQSTKENPLGGPTIATIRYSSVARGTQDRAASDSRTSATAGTTSRRHPLIVDIAAQTLLDGDHSWPVKVTINSIDYDTMALTGTMEAFNVPNKHSPRQKSTIATHLEGEIIDFNQYTLATKSFDADPSVDSLHWRELEPFKGLTDKEVVHSLVSKKWLQEELGEKYILMRWKEKSFITPLDAQAHLTISGFYYVSLRREDGHVEGLYFDRATTPYQHLLLSAANRDFPSFQFR